MRESLDCSKLNRPKLIAGIDFKLVVGITIFFGYAALMFHVWGLMLLPVAFLGLLHGPAQRDSEFVKIHIRHRQQRPRYSPGYVTAQNWHAPRPRGFSRGETV